MIGTDGSGPTGRTDLPDPLVIAVVEDNAVDVELLRAAADRLPHHPVIRAFPTGTTAIEHIASDPTGTDLVLLDLNLPGVDGIEVLETLRGHPDLRHLPVVVLSSSKSEADIRQAYTAGANAYLGKPLGLAPMVDLLDGICRFWTMVVRPGRPG